MTMEDAAREARQRFLELSGRCGMHCCHSRGSGDPVFSLLVLTNWVPAFAGKTGD